MTDIDDADVVAEAEAVNGRRNLLTKGAVAAAVAAVAGVAVSKNASAADGDPLNIGEANTGTVSTVLGGGSALRVNNGTSEDVPGIGKPSIYGRTTATNGIGVLGEAFATGGPGVVGRARSTGPGVYGLNDSTTGGAGVAGDSTNGPDLAAIGSGRVLVGAAGVTNPPTGGALGTIARDAAGNLWYAVAAGVWRKLAGAGTAGSFHPINPARVYDSRLAAYAPNDGLMARNTDRTVSVKDGRDATGAIVAADIVPAGATAVAINVTIASPTGPNFLSVVPGDAASFTASTINWPGGFDAANGAIVKLDASRQLKVFCGDQAGSTHVIIDVTGYYL